MAALPEENKEGAELFIMLAFGQGDAAAALDLIARGATLNHVNSEGVTTLMCAAAEGDADIVKAMLGAGRDVALNAQDDHGWTALITAVHRGHREVVRQLLAAGADIDIADEMKRTALDYAKDKSVGGIHSLLLRAAVRNKRAAAEKELVRTATVTQDPIRVMRPLTFRNSR